MFSPYLERQLNPVNIIPALYAARVINNEDKDEIMTVYNRIGATAASMILLQLIQQRLDPELWYHQFLKILFECGYEDLAKILEPEFHPDADFKCPQVNDKKDELLSMDKDDPRKAADMLAHYILETNNLKDVLGALYAADYPYLADLLSEGRVSNQHYSVFRNKIHIFFPYICERVEPSTIIPHLYASGVINHVDREEILALKDQCSDKTATSHLLECMQCRQSPKMWYTQFLTALEKNGQRDLADLIEPGFCSDPELWTRKVDEIFDIDSLLSDGSIPTSGETGVILLATEELKELAAHEESILKSAVNIRLELETMQQERRKDEQRLYVDVQSQQSNIIEKIERKKTLLLNRYKHRSGDPHTLDLQKETKVMKANKLKTKDNKLATLLLTNRQTSSLSPLVGTIESNVLNKENDDSHGRYETLSDASTKQSNVSYDDRNGVTSVEDEIEVYSDISPPSSGYLIVTGGGLEEREAEQQSGIVVSALVHHRAAHLTEHQGCCVFSDITFLSNGELAVADSQHACIMLMDSHFCFKKQIELEGHPLHIGTLADNQLALHVESTSNIILCQIETSKTRILQWICQSNICTLCTDGGMNIYTLCEGKHMHVFKLDCNVCDDYNFGGIQENKWWPRFMAVDDPVSSIYLTERNTSTLYCFTLKDEILSLKWKYKGEDFLSLSGIVVCSINRVVIADLNNNSLLELDTKGNYKNEHIDKDIVRPYALAVFEDEIFVTRANTGRNDKNKTITSYKIQFGP